MAFGAQLTAASDYLFRRLFKFVFRYDIFISYARRDGKEYAAKLRDQLHQLDYSCFLDYDELPAGNSLTSTLRRALKRSAAVVVVGTEGALQSSYVGLEVEEFARTGRAIIPIDFQGTLAAAPWAVIRDRDIVWIDETREALARGAPSPLVADQIEKLFKYTRRNVRVRGQIIATAALFLLGAALAVFLVQQQVHAANAALVALRTQEEVAHDATRTAAAEQSKAQSALESAARAEAEAAVKQLIAVFERARADEQVKIAEAKTAEAARAQAAARDAEQRAIAEGLRAEEQARATRISYSNFLAAQSRGSTESYPQRSLLLAAEALNARRPDDPPVPAAESALRTALTRVGGRVLGGFTDYVTHVAISHDRRWAIGSDKVGVTYLWDLHDTDPAATARALPNSRGPFAFSPDGRWLATAGGRRGEEKGDGTAFLLDLQATGAAAEPRPLGEHGSPVDALVFTGDGRWLVTGSKRDEYWIFGTPKASVKLWRMGAPDPTAAPVALPGALNFFAEVSPEGRWLVTDNRGESNPHGQVLTLWDLSAADPAAKPLLLRGHAGVVSRAVASPDGRWLATSSSVCSQGDDHTVRLWDLRAPDPSAAPVVLDRHKGPVGATVFTPDGKELLTGGDGGGVTGCETDPVTLAWSLERPGAPPRVVGDVGEPAAVSGEALVTRRGEYFTFLHAYLTGSENRGGSFDLRGMLMSVSPDRRLLVTINMDWQLSADINQLVTEKASPSVNLWGLGESLIQPLTLRGHDRLVTAFAFSRDRRAAVTGSMDKTIRVWDVSALSEPYPMPRVLKGVADNYAQNFGRPWVVTHSPGQPLRAFDISAPDPFARPVVLPWGGGERARVAASDDGRWLAAADPAGGEVQVWDMTADDPAARPRTLRGRASALAFSPDGRWLAAGGDKGVVRLWDIQDPSDAPRELVAGLQFPALGGGAPSRKDIFEISFSRDNRWLVVNRDLLWDLHDRRPDAPPATGENYGSLVLGPDGRWMVSELYRTVKLWDLRAASPAAAARELRGAEGPFLFTDNGRWLLTAAPGGGAVAALWDLQAADPTARSLPLPGAEVGLMKAVASSPDGRWLAVGGQTGTLLWDLRQPRAAPTFLPGGQGDVGALDFSADSLRLVTSSFTAATIWDLGAPSPAESGVTMPGGVAYDVAAFARHGRDPAASRWLRLSRGMDESLVLWPVPAEGLKAEACRVAGRNLTREEWKEFFPGQPYRATCTGLPEGN